MKKWIVEIENKPNQRIIVIYNPLEDKLEFYGQYKMRNEWVNFSVETTNNLTLDMIQEKLLSIAETMDMRVKTYEDLQKSFALIKKIEIIVETQNNIDQDQVYGFDEII
jgi:hypothetical protein